jgi:hypothetical protein
MLFLWFSIFFISHTRCHMGILRHVSPSVILMCQLDIHWINTSDYLAWAGQHRFTGSSITPDYGGQWSMIGILVRCYWLNLLFVKGVTAGSTSCKRHYYWNQLLVKGVKIGFNQWLGKHTFIDICIGCYCWSQLLTKLLLESASCKKCYCWNQLLVKGVIAGISFLWKVLLLESASCKTKVLLLKSAYWKSCYCWNQLLVEGVIVGTSFLWKVLLLEWASWKRYWLLLESTSCKRCSCWNQLLVKCVTGVNFL